MPSTGTASARPLSFGRSRVSGILSAVAFSVSAMAGQACQTTRAVETDPAKLSLAGTPSQYEYEEDGNLFQEISVAEKTGNMERAKALRARASTLFEKIGFFLKAAEAAEKAGDMERAKMLWIKFSIQEEEGGDLLKAAYAAKKAGDREREKQLLRKLSIQEEEGGDLLRAAAAAIMAGDFERAEELRERIRELNGDGE